jgi:hypothetical protein
VGQQQQQQQLEATQLVPMLECGSSSVISISGTRSAVSVTEAVDQLHQHAAVLYETHVGSDYCQPAFCQEVVGRRQGWLLQQRWDQSGSWFWVAEL